MLAPDSRRDRVRAMLADLKMPGALEAADGILARADGGAATAAEAIEELLAAQIALRNNRRLDSAMRSSRLPAVKTLAQFDFAFQPSIKRGQIESLHELGFVERAENVVLLGPPGVGKTHLAISLAIAAAESGRRVYYGTLADLVDSLAEAKTAGGLARRLKVLTHPAVLVVDEIAARWSRREEKGAPAPKGRRGCGAGNGPTARLAPSCADDPSRAPPFRGAAVPGPAADRCGGRAPAGRVRPSRT